MTAISGTHHQTTLDKREPAIFAAIRGTRGVKKVKPGPMNWTGPTHPRLDLQLGEFPGLLNGWLYLGSGKRACRIFIEVGASIELLNEDLKETLARFGIDLKFIGGEPMMSADSDKVDSIFGEIPSPVLSPENRWALCETIFQLVGQVKKLEEQELELELQLEEVRNQTEQARAGALQTLSQVRL